MAANRNNSDLKNRLEELVEDMLDGSIMLNEATEEFEKVFITKALERNNRHISKTAGKIGIHRNTLSKRISEYD
ncbi:MAG: hypothetical protein HKN33_13000 [Pyrinomonadaceae bacterium]|nr:hypothetical protein [Pyrinomonadaceae bacterium]